MINIRWTSDNQALGQEKVVGVEFDIGGQVKVLDSKNPSIDVNYTTIAKTRNKASVILEHIESLSQRKVWVKLGSIRPIKGSKVCDFVLSKEGRCINGEFVAPQKDQSRGGSWSPSSRPAKRQQVGPAVSVPVSQSGPLEVAAIQSSPQPVSGSPKVLLVMGNSGSGKSTLLNRMLGRGHFPAGPEITTDSLTILEHKGFYYCDTPGRADLLEETLASVNLRLRQDGSYKLLFVCSWLNEGVNPEDVAFVEAVLKGLEFKDMPFSILVTRIPFDKSLDLKENPELKRQKFGCLHRLKNIYSVILDHWELETLDSLRDSFMVALSRTPECKVSSGSATTIPNEEMCESIRNWHQYLKSRLSRIKPAYRELSSLQLLEPLFNFFSKASIETVHIILKHLFEDGPNKGEGLDLSFNSILNYLVEAAKKKEEEKRLSLLRPVPEFGPNPSPSGVQWQPRRWHFDPRARDPFGEELTESWKKDIRKVMNSPAVLKWKKAVLEEKGLYSEEMSQDEVEGAYEQLRISEMPSGEELNALIEKAEKSSRSFWLLNLPPSLSPAQHLLGGRLSLSLPQQKIEVLNWNDHLKRKLSTIKEVYKDPELMGLLESFCKLCNMISIPTTMTIVNHLCIEDNPPKDFRGVWLGMKLLLKELQDAERMKPESPVRAASSSSPSDWRPSLRTSDPRARDPLGDYVMHSYEAPEKDIKRIRESKLSERYKALRDVGLLPNTLSQEKIDSAYEDLVFKECLERSKKVVESLYRFASSGPSAVGPAPAPAPSSGPSKPDALPLPWEKDDKY